MNRTRRIEDEPDRPSAVWTGVKIGFGAFVVFPALALLAVWIGANGLAAVGEGAADPALRAAVERFAEVQEAFHDSEGRYSNSYDELGFQPTMGITVVPRSFEDGWFAVGTEVGTSHSCAVFGGLRPESMLESTRLVPRMAGEVACN